MTFPARFSRSIVLTVVVVLAAAATVSRGAANPPATQPSDSAEAGADAAELVVRVRDLRNANGHLRLGVFTKAEGFPASRDAALLWRSVAADADAPAFAIQLPPGRYAVVVLHDEDGDKQLDKNWIGVPKEGYGVSNNPKPRLRAATFEEAAFELPEEGIELAVSIQYF